MSRRKQDRTKSAGFSRRDFLEKGTIAAAGIMLPAACARFTETNMEQNHMAKSRDRPNVLTILVDQLRYDVFSHRGHPILQTPNIDRLAREGVIFSDATCSSPLCGPARAALLSGCYAFDGKYRHLNVEPEKSGLWIQNITTVDEALAEAGYHVEYHGKWHTGSEHLECYQGDRRVFGHHIADYHAYLAEKYSEPKIEKSRSPYKRDRYTQWPYRYWPVDDMMQTAPMNGFSMPHNNEAGVIDVADDDTLTAWTAKKTIKFLKSVPQAPFAVTCSVLHPHAPLIASETYATMFDPADMPMPENVAHSFEPNPPIPDAVPADASGLGQFIALYFGLVKELDDWVGKILDTLDETGLTNNTLVVFTADHGELMGSHRTFSKGLLYEECLRVPLIVRHPRLIDPSSTMTPACGVDVAPTILDLCGLGPLEQFHGASLRKKIGSDSADDNFAYSELGGNRYLRSRRWKFASLADGIERLFDLKNDPYETRDLLSERPVPKGIETLRNDLVQLIRTKYCSQILQSQSSLASLSVSQKPC